jgi:hypothetical protein
MHSVQRVGITAEVVATASGETRRTDGSLEVRIGTFAVLVGGRRLDSGRLSGGRSASLASEAGGWSLELIEAEVREHAARIIEQGGPTALFGDLVDALTQANVDAAPAELAALPIDVELGPQLWGRFSAIVERRPALRVSEDYLATESVDLDEATAQELEHLLSYAEHCGQAADRAQRDDIRSSTLAYIGGALTTMLHLGHIDAHQHSQWHERLIKALGEPPGGWKFIGW